MNRRNLDLLRSMCSTFFLLAFLAGTSHAISFNFDRIQWEDTMGGTYADEDWGQVNVTMNSLDGSLFYPSASVDAPGFYGFLNIVTDTSSSGGMSNNWAVQNAPIHFYNASELPDRLPESFRFDLGSTLGVGNLNFHATIDPTPLAFAPGGGLFSGVGVGVTPVTETQGGENLYLGPQLIEGITRQAAPDKARNFQGALVGDMVSKTGKIQGKESDIAAVDEGLNGCAPAAVARSLKYMDAQHANVTIADTAQQAYDKLRNNAHMMTTIGAVGGTATPKIKTGKDKYVKDNKLPIVTTQTDNVHKAIETLKAGGDVEVGVLWGKNAAGQSLGAHRAFVSEITKTKDAMGNVTGYTVKYIDDKQGDGMAMNRSGTLNFDKDGNLKGSNMGKLINFQVEDVLPPIIPKRFNPLNMTPLAAVVGVDPQTPLIPTELLQLNLQSVSPVTMNFQPLSSPDPEKLNLAVAGAPSSAPLAPGEKAGFNLHLENQDSMGSLIGQLRQLTPAPQDLLLTNFVQTSTFFDITWEIKGPSHAFDRYQIFQVHGEIPVPLQGTVWFTDFLATPAPSIDSFFDVFVELQLDPLAPSSLHVGGMPLVNLSAMAFSVVPEPATWLLAVLGFAALRSSRRR